jgi:hypothetical protein
MTTESPTEKFLMRPRFSAMAAPPAGLWAPTQAMLFAGYIADPGDDPAPAPGRPPRL